VWILKWQVKCASWENLFWQMPHLNGLSPVWTLKCLVKFASRENAFWQRRHLKGLSPVCVLVWRIKSPLLLKVFEQMSQLWVFFLSSLCTFKCCFKWNLNLKLFEQISQSKSFIGCTASRSSLWDSMLATEKQHMLCLEPFVTLQCDHQNCLQKLPKAKQTAPARFY